ncbi:MAG: DUF4270 domain-containing protein [Flavobacteriaceae bacterium]|jgi:hypothetical protein|nr:DUF4270 domain-containing protein [Flavobacteriaceae bacterium]MDG1791068.1 DUF4270 domain-containing protein [Flavobacteriaceae bacterium]MDG2447210.1 DUF4270 domain-containing protein [Flavobacteriaceae bacterium]
MNTRTIMPKVAAILFFIISIVSCQEDFNTIGSDIIGDGSLLSQLDNTKTVVAYSRKLAPVQTNIIPVSQLGVFNDGTFGKSSISFLTQLQMETPNVIFGDSIGHEITLDSVMLYIPYYNQNTTEDGVTSYTLDSVYGASPINININESNYFLRDLDPSSNFQDAQLYYSNEATLFEANLLQNELATEIIDFIPSSEGYEIINRDTSTDGSTQIDTTIIAPGIRVALSNDYFQEKILGKEGAPELSNDNNFKDYFRGLYFKVNSDTEDGNLLIFNPELATITLYYNFLRADVDSSGDPVLDDDGNAVIDTIYNNYILRFGGINLNVFDNELTPDIAAAIANPNTLEGDETLYLRGGDGIMTVINLFGEDVDSNGIADELEVLRDQEWIIDDARLKFYIDQNKVTGGNTEPERISIYNINNSTVLADYFLDPTSSNLPAEAITNHLGKIERDTDNNGVSYTINLTHHISNLINKDSTNVSLGLMTSQNVLLNGFQKLDTLLNPNQELPTIKTVQRSSVISHEGTVLYGNNTLNEDKKLVLEIYYTEPN